MWKDFESLCRCFSGYLWLKLDRLVRFMGIKSTQQPGTGGANDLCLRDSERVIKTEIHS